MTACFFMVEEWALVEGGRVETGASVVGLLRFTREGSSTVPGNGVLGRWRGSDSRYSCVCNLLLCRAYPSTHREAWCSVGSFASSSRGRQILAWGNQVDKMLVSCRRWTSRRVPSMCSL